MLLIISVSHWRKKTVWFSPWIAFPSLQILGYVGSNKKLPSLRSQNIVSEKIPPFPSLHQQLAPRQMCQDWGVGNRGSACLCICLCYPKDNDVKGSWTWCWWPRFSDNVSRNAQEQKSNLIGSSFFVLWQDFRQLLQPSWHILGGVDLKNVKSRREFVIFRKFKIWRE